MKNKVALVVIDSGFSRESLSLVADRVLGIYDLRTGRKAVGKEVDVECLSRLAGDPMNHGAVILERLARLSPASPVVLVRAFSQENSVLRTQWSHGEIKSPGWTEAYLWAVELCKSLGYLSVANFSFGGAIHALDGTGWESFRVGQVTGSGKPGHIAIAAAGPGDGRAVHARVSLRPGVAEKMQVLQIGTTHYNFWVGIGCVHSHRDWEFSVFRDGHYAYTINGNDVPTNMWNGKQQQTFTLQGSGHVELALWRPHQSADTACGDPNCPVRFDCWINSEEQASFQNHTTGEFVVEPAILPQVIAVGLRSSKYSSKQTEVGHKPEVLLPGSGMISFRIPEVVSAVATMLGDSDEPLDVDAVRKLLGKYPELPTA